MKRLAMIFCLIILLYPPVSAASMPVIDLASIAQMIKVVKEAKLQLEQLQSLRKTNKNQYNFLQKNLNGNFGYGNLLNDKASLNRRQWSNDSWTDVLNESSGGHASAFSNAQRKYDQLYPVKSSRDVLKTRGDGSLDKTHYEQTREISRAALAASAFSYDQINEHIKNLHDMLAQLENESSEKAALDLNARLVAEVAFIQLEALRQQNIQTQLMATNTQREVNDVSQQSDFMTWDK